jgi:hypothetical protein
MLQIDPTNIAVVGEYTTASGPYDEDYFLVIIERDGRTTELPVAGVTPADHTWLEAALGLTIDFQLANRTDFTSRIIFPEELRGQPLFRFEKEKLTLTSFWRSLKLMGPWGYVRHSLMEDVERYLRKPDRRD